MQVISTTEVFERSP